MWPTPYLGHAATVINNVLHQRSPVLAIIGGGADHFLIDIEKKTWREVWSTQWLIVSEKNRKISKINTYWTCITFD